VLTSFDLNLRHLRGAIAVRSAGNVSAAAAAVNLSQPALTQGIVKLETLLGHSLFERQPRAMVPTAAGALALDRFQAALAHLSKGGRNIAGTAFQVDRRLTMSQLRAFLAVLESGSFAAAAPRTGLSQPALHRSVRELEKALGGSLVERRGRSVTVNAVGRRFGRSCRLAHGELQAVLSELGPDPNKSVIAVGTTPLARAYLVPEAMALMTAERSPAGFQVFEGSWGELVETLRDGLIDLIVGELPPYDSPDLLKLPLYEEQLVIAAGRQHPLAGQASVSPSQLARYPWIIGPENSPLRAEWERLFAVPRPSAPVECGSIMITARLLTSSDMLTLATPDQVALQIRSGLLAQVGKPLPGARHAIGVTLRRSWQTTSAQGRFLQLLQEASVRAAAPDRRNSFIHDRWVR
jgi:LysR family transcriptional regulator, regulator for genes of the gallate degradation pathway